MYCNVLKDNNKGYSYEGREKGEIYRERDREIIQQKERGKETKREGQNKKRKREKFQILVRIGREIGRKEERDREKKKKRQREKNRKDGYEE
jgi:hypothetical protein